MTISRHDHDTLRLPLAPAMGFEQEMRLYARFMQHFRHVPHSRASIKILSAIQFTADMLGYSDAHVAKTLVELGLRAPRLAFPAAFLSYVDAALLRSGWEVGGPTLALVELKTFWDEIGEDKFSAFKGDYPLSIAHVSA